MEPMTPNQPVTGTPEPGDEIRGLLPFNLLALEAAHQVWRRVPAWKDRPIRLVDADTRQNLIIFPATITFTNILTVEIIKFKGEWDRLPYDVAVDRLRPIVAVATDTDRVMSGRERLTC